MQQEHWFTGVWQRLWRGLFILPIKAYQLVISPLFSGKCAYQPTCSHYAAGAIKEWGVAKGIWMGAKRIGRCHPWGGFGYDPVPRRPRGK
ncbi:MAG: membrane protein insertion efficiency factor YidD [Saprospiraceae bacterium]|jgi:putative membrane protein insertion efficiency factor